MKNLKHIKDLLYKYKYRYISGILCLLAVDALQLVLPWVLGVITDQLKAGSLSSKSLIMYALYIVFIAIGIALFRFLWRYLVLGVSRLIEQALRNRFYQQLQSLSSNYYNNHKTGDLMAHATNDINNVTEALGQGFVFAVDSAIIPIVAVTMMLRTAGPALTFASFSPLFILALVIVLFVKVIHKRVMDMQEAFSSLTETARENFSGIRVVKSFVQELLEIDKFRKANFHNKKMNLRFVTLMSLMFPTVMTFSALSFAIALWFGGVQVIEGRLSLGAFIAFNSYLGLLTWPIAALGWVVSIFQRGFVSLERINIIMDEVPEIQDSSSTSDIKHIKGEISFKSLTFRYPGSDIPALNDISLTVESGKTLAVVGRTGGDSGAWKPSDEWSKAEESKNTEDWKAAEDWKPTEDWNQTPKYNGPKNKNLMGLILVLLGIIFLGKQMFHWVDVKYFLPLILIAIGGYIIYKGRRNQV